MARHKILLLLFFPLLSFTQNVISGDEFEGSIFLSTYKNSAYNFLDNNKRFTPSIEEIQKFENALKTNLKSINKNLENQKRSCTVIHRNLKKYVRQYLGFIDDSGNKYLLVNFLWKESIEPESEYRPDLADWTKHWQVWFDGCSNFWNVKFYVESNKLFDLQINGSS